ncbi:hypothetical protein [Gordonia humi]|uniref:Putative membrane protein n=1 Tax=Gordonia humi TaxID=686429 RepID=A0A840FF54_9ACTN|nr:hypothetical protein [Gordonia humi]MBB4138077.1 putative membrane protein [Gordonia humi]
MSTPSNPDRPHDTDADYTQVMGPHTPPPRPQTLAYTHIDNTYDSTPYESADQLYPGPVDPSYPTYPQQAPPAAPAGLGPRPSFDPGVDLPKYVGSAAVTAAIVGILAYVGAVIIEAIATRWVGVEYWTEHQLTQPAADGVLWAWVAAGAIVAAGLMWLLLKITNLAGSFFTALAVLAVLAFGLVALLAGPWQSTIGPAALGVIVILTITTLTTGYTRLSVTTPEHY